MAELRVTVCHVRPDLRFLQELSLPQGASLKDALDCSGLQAAVPDLDLAQAKVGVFGKVKDPATPLRDGDRVEVYRPLIADPKESRRRRVGKKEAGK